MAGSRSALTLLAGLWLSALLFPGVAGKCGYQKFECGNDVCIDAQKRCDGDRDCDNGSDEGHLCDKAAPFLRFPVGGFETLRAQYELEHGHLQLSLCNRNGCSALGISGASRDGSLWYGASTDCNPTGRGCDWGPWVKPDGGELFSTGEVVLGVEHRPLVMAVWVLGHPEQAVSVSVPDDADLLRVTPFRWTSDMPVRFQDSLPGLAAYRWNETQVFLRWLQPLHKVENYEVFVDGRGTSAGAGKPCYAWPHMMCHVALTRRQTSNVSVIGFWSEEKKIFWLSATLRHIINATAAPRQVSNLRAEDKTHFSLRIRWRMPWFINGTVRQYIVTPEKLQGNVDPLNSGSQDDQPDPPQGVTPPDYSYKLYGLRPETWYNVSVLCVGSGGNSTAWGLFQTESRDSCSATGDC